MNDKYLQHPACFFTATNYEWKPVLADDKHKDIILASASVPFSFSKPTLITAKSRRLSPNNGKY